MSIAEVRRYKWERPFEFMELIHIVRSMVKLSSVGCLSANDLCRRLGQTPDGQTPNALLNTHIEAQSQIVLLVARLARADICKWC